MSEGLTQVVTADWVFPMSAPPIWSGAVAIENKRIVAVGSAADIQSKFPAAARRVMNNCALLPGLVNAHCHLELTHRVRPPAPIPFADWLAEMIRLGRDDASDPNRLDEVLKSSVTAGVRQCLACGVTSVGDVSSSCRQTRALLRDGPIRIVSYGEVIGMSLRRNLIESKLAAAASREAQSEFLLCGITPHSPYSTEIPGYRRSLEMAAASDYPLATHLAESPDETQFLADGSGNLGRLWERLGGQDELIPRFAGGPIRMAKEIGLLDYPTLLAHVNYCDDSELEILAAGHASVVWCPRTHEYFNHPPHRWRELIVRGVNVAIGTDSAASSGDVNLLADLRLVRRQNPAVPAIALFELITTRAAAALNPNDQSIHFPRKGDGSAAAVARRKPGNPDRVPPALRGIGRLEAGGVADMVAFPVEMGEPLESILKNEQCAPRAVWVAGKPLAIDA